MMLSEEFVPSLAPNTGVSLGKGRSLGEYMITGAVVVGRQLFAISAAHATLLTLDLATHRIVAAHVVPGLANPVGLAAQGGDLVILGADGTITVIARPLVSPTAVMPDSTTH
jgi:hypothetical protein